MRLFSEFGLRLKMEIIIVNLLKIIKYSLVFRQDQPKLKGYRTLSIFHDYLLIVNRFHIAQLQVMEREENSEEQAENGEERREKLRLEMGNNL